MPQLPRKREREKEEEGERRNILTERYFEQHKQKQQHLRAIPRGACLIPRGLSDWLGELCFEGVSLQ